MTRSATETAQADLIREAKNAAASARGAAEIIQGIPIYMSLYFTLDRIASNLERAVRRAETTEPVSE